MRAIRLHTEGDSAWLASDEVPDPRPGRGEALIRVHAAGVTLSEPSWYPTSHTEDGKARALPVLGHEFSGVVEAVGEGVSGAATGQAVYGMNDWFADGAMAEYCVSRTEWIAPKPHSLDYVQAAAVPIGALTAWQGLFDRAGLRRGETVLVHGGAGAVGTWAVQMGRWCGAHVIATVSAEDSAFVRELGAHETIDFRARRFEDAVSDVDVVFDTVGGDTLARSWGVLNKGGRMVTIASSSEADSDPRTKNAFFIVEPKRAQLVRIGELIDGGHLQPVVAAVFPLGLEGRAWNVDRRSWTAEVPGLARRRGKIVVRAAAASRAA